LITTKVALITRLIKRFSKIHFVPSLIQELQAKLQNQEEELGAAREANRQLMSQLNKTAANEGFDGLRGTIQHAASRD
jgi:hypothetical protein